MTTKELTTSEAAAHLDESDRLVRLWCQQGRFPNARRIEHPRGDYWVIPFRDVESFVKPKPGPAPKANGAAKAMKKPVAKKGGKK
ncbi:MAG: helix-turn-helix domain-containing protein [Pyrinomonadaceae bacterium]